MLAVHKQDKLVATIAGLLHYEIAAELAAQRPDVKGPGTFVPALIDELDNIRRSNADGDFSWLSRADIALVSFE
jgi:thiamine-phosphate diphosphorylase/hydroxyethylthiazole kinase